MPVTNRAPEVRGFTYVGYVATALAVVMGLGGIVMGAMSLPDIRRYLKIRSM